MSKVEQQMRIRKIMIYALNATLRAGVIPPQWFYSTAGMIRGPSTLISAL